MLVLILIIIFLFYFIPFIDISIKQFIIILILLIWLIYIINYLIKVFRENVKNKFHHNKDLLNSMGNNVLELSYLYDGKITKSVFTIMIIDLIRKGVIWLRTNIKADDYILIYNKNNLEKLTRTELKLIDLLFNKMGNNEKISLNDIQKQAFYNNSNFKLYYMDWFYVATVESLKYSYFSSRKHILDKHLGFIMAILFLAVFGIFINLNTSLIILSLIFTLIFTFYINYHYNRTDEGKIKYDKMVNLNEHIMNGIIFEEIKDVNIASNVIIYSKIFKIKIEKKYNEYLNNKEFNNDFIMYAKKGIIDDLYSKINRIVFVVFFLSDIFPTKQSFRLVKKHKGGNYVRTSNISK